MDYFGYSSAAALGYIHGGFRGAYYGTKSYGKYLSKKNMAPVKRKYNGRVKKEYKRQKLIGPRMAGGAFYTNKTQYASTPHQNPLNAQAKRASMKRTGRSKVKSIVHRKKRVKVSKPLRKKIQKVIDGEAYKGMYSTTRFGTIGVTTTGNSGPANTENIVENMGGYTNQLAFQKVNKDFSGNRRFWFAHALQATNGTATAVQRLEPGSEWQFFSPLKILDAASVLWNSKLIAKDYSVQQNNFNTVHNEGNATPIIGTPQQPGIKGLKVHVVNSYVKFTLKNNSQRALKVTVYNCVPAIRFPETTPLQAFQDALFTESDGVNSAFISSVGPQFTNLTQDDASFGNPSVQPNMLKSFRSSWKYEKIVIKIAPGETCSHSVQGPRGYELDYMKLWNSGDDEQGKAYKGTSMFVMMALELDLAYAVGGVGSVAGEAGRTGHYGPGTSAANTLADPISIQWDEVYRLAIPDIAGFATAAAAAGVTQVLNKKIPRMAFGNFTAQSSADANPVYSAFDEENPAATIATGLFN